MEFRANENSEWYGKIYKTQENGSETMEGYANTLDQIDGNFLVSESLDLITFQNGIGLMGLSNPTNIDSCKYLCQNYLNLYLVYE